MKFIKKITEELKFIRTSKRMLAAVADIGSTSDNLVPDDIERTVDRYPDNIAFIDDERQWTYGEFDAYANQVARWALAQGLKRGDTVCFFARNRLEYVGIWFGLSKAGIVPALINYQLRAAALAHCVKISRASLVIVDCEYLSAWRSAKKHLPDDLQAFGAFGKAGKLADFDAEIARQDTARLDDNVRKGMKAGDLFMKMFTSGTTGLPKAAKMTHTRGQYYMRGFVVPSDAGPDDRMMMVLPMYHATGGLCGVGIVLMVGGAVIVRPKFSATSFWDEAVRFKATLFMYVGELCRFLLSAPVGPHDRTHSIRLIVGNGLRPEVWSEFVERFNIPGVFEFYGATEGNISLFNFTGKVGAVGRVPNYMRKKTNGDLIRFDVETNTHIRGEDGFCQRTSDDEIGELIGEIRSDEARFRYEGYEDKQASAKKILHDVYVKGDAWFRTGDLLWRDEDGYYYFADRIGDTFRWKAENVSTNEVAAALTEFEGVHQANVYGVPIKGYDGKAGMAALVADKDLDLAGLYQQTKDALPRSARPVFLRISNETDTADTTDTTGTFKYKKTDLVKQGFDPAKISDPVYMADPDKDKYIRVTASVFSKIKKGGYKL